jgi:2-keto-3-deoxy-galactonokinase
MLSRVGLGTNNRSGLLKGGIVVPAQEGGLLNHLPSISIVSSSKKPSKRSRSQSSFALSVPRTSEKPLRISSMLFVMRNLELLRLWFNDQVVNSVLSNRFFIGFHPSA